MAKNKTKKQSPRSTKTKRSLRQRIVDLEFMFKQYAIAMAQLGRQLAESSKILGNYIAVTDVLIQKGLITEKEIFEHMKELQEQALDVSDKTEEVVDEVLAEVADEGEA